ncbi:MAG: glycoside hydrolase family 127 protein [Bacteroidales bacterium]|nr:glycoside hydrolase family 127 protein [Bacteroidales bacterium]
MILYALITALQVAVAPVFNREPLEPTSYAQLPLGAIKPEGWLKEQLQRQATGLTGNLDQVYPQVMGDSNAWLGGDGDAWERGPYWIDGLLPLAYILDNQELKTKALRWVNAILDSQQEDGYMGPREDHPFVYGLQRGKSHDWWPKMVALKILQQYYNATGDQRVISCLTKYFKYQAEHLPSEPLNHWSTWGEWRGGDNLEVVLWLYNITGENWLLELADLIHGQTVPWISIFADRDIICRQNSIHTVNLAQGFKEPVVWSQYSRDGAGVVIPRHITELMRTTVGIPNGLWAGDEQLNFGHPNRGSELCAAVEMMFSAEEMLRISRMTFWADFLERIAFNALPTQISDDFTAKQYYQQTNQIACTREWRPFSTPHDDVDNLFGTLNGYPCCLSNMHQGWPKFTQNLWYASDDGLAAMVYAPCSVTAKLPTGEEVRITETTDYPFNETVTFKLDFTARKVRKADFVLHLRVPSWSSGAVLSVNGAKRDVPAMNKIVNIKRTWKKGDVVQITFRARLTTEEWWDGAWTFVRGPLVYALKMQEKWTWIPFEGRDRYYGPGAWEVTSDTPWNYCIMREELDTDKCQITVSDKMAAYPWNVESAPISITVPARVLPRWKEFGGCAGEIPFFTEDGMDVGEECTIELIPYGCTTLRIAEFPTRIIPWDLSFRETY